MCVHRMRAIRRPASGPSRIWFHASVDRGLAVPVSIVGAYRQNRYGNVRIKDGIVIGCLSAAGVLVGVGVANAIPERALQLLFTALTLFVAVQVFRRGLRQRRERLAEEAAQG